MQDDFAYCRSVLPKVSRTFTLAIRVLPAALNRPVLTAYLLCRVADTVEDDTSIPKGRRIEVLRDLERWVDPSEGASPADPSETDERVQALAASSRFKDLDPEMAESWRLAGQVSRVLRCYRALPEPQREHIARCIREMASGMASFVSRETAVVKPSACGESAPLVGTLSDEADLAHYADFVAGTVGRLLQGLFCDHLGIADGALMAGLEETATPFGHGLQYTNIIQDLVADRRRGWCYIPETLALKHGLTVEDVFDPTNQDAAVRIVQDLIRDAFHHLESALEFTLLIPGRAPRIRLFCLWPLFLAVATLTRAWGSAKVLDQKIKVGRDEVRRLMRATSLRCLWGDALRRLYVRESLWLRAQV